MKYVAATASLLILIAACADNPAGVGDDHPPSSPSGKLTLSNSVASTCDGRPCAPGFGGSVGTFQRQLRPWPGVLVVTAPPAGYYQADHPRVYRVQASGWSVLTGPEGVEDPRYASAFGLYSQEPAWSPDGTRITFASTRDGATVATEVYYEATEDTRREISSSEHAQLVADWEAWEVYQALPSPHQRRFDDDGDGLDDEDPIDFVDNDGDGRVDEDGPRLLAPSTTPDGPVTEDRRHGDGNIWVMDEDGTGLEQVTTDPGFDGSPAWSPDGALIAFVSDRSGEPHIWVHDLVAATERQITTSSGEVRGSGLSSGTPLSWSPDRTRIAYTRWDSESRVPSIRSVPAAGGESIDIGHGVSFSDWAYDGAAIVVALPETYDESGNILEEPGVGILHEDGTLRVVNRGDYSCDCAWTPEGLVVRSVTGVALIDLDGRELSALDLSDLPGRVEEFAWRP